VRIYKLIDIIRYFTRYFKFNRDRCTYNRARL